MDHQSSKGLQQFRNQVGIKFQLYNSLFTSLPFHRIEKTGILLSLLSNNCEEGYKRKQSPEQIIHDFFTRHTSYEKEEERIDLLFRFIQYVERQVVLFDALEDAAFRDVHDMNGVGTLKHLESEVVQSGKNEELAARLKEFSVRLVLTAHPTQFYPGSVLGIINDLSKALSENNTSQVNMYLQQLGKTPFFKHQKPTPYDEAVSLIWYLENIFYPAAGRIVSFLKHQFPGAVDDQHIPVRMGFWPGGDRDGNPHVTADVTMKVAEALRGGIIKCYYLEVRRLRRRLTFKGVEQVLSDLEKQLYNNIFIPGHRTDLTKEDILGRLLQIKETLVYQHNSLFLPMLESLINKVNIFGLHFATLDVRQDSSVHTKVLKFLQAAGTSFSLITSYASTDETADESLVKETLESFRTIRQIQQYNGEEGCNRYIISQCTGAQHVMEVAELFLLSGWKAEEMNIDIVPLFETIDDLKNAAGVMKQLYEHEWYKLQLQRRGGKQTIMLGFSDGTKDGGYLMANWSIYKAKEELTQISRAYGISVVFFDGRGGPPARGGGKTHKFYASMGKNISNNEIQLTVQGQTVSSNFGTIDAAQFNIEQLLNAGISNDLFSARAITLEPSEEALLNELAESSFAAYVELKNHPDFMTYLSNVSPLRFYADTNIGSRPAKRNSSSRLTLKDLRAIPYVGAWSQLKQNVTGYYGVGTALKKMDEEGRFNQVKKLYQESLFFRTLIGNCEMAMKKCFFPLTEYLSAHPHYAEMWNKINDEFETTQRYILKLSGRTELMSEYPVEQLSVQMRERIVLPLLTIQQYAIGQIRAIEEKMTGQGFKDKYEKLVIRCSFGIINAGRNSA